MYWSNPQSVFDRMLAAMRQQHGTQPFVCPLQAKQPHIIDLIEIDGVWRLPPDVPMHEAKAG
jgi:hypothetical protein